MLVEQIRVSKMSSEICISSLALTRGLQGLPGLDYSGSMTLNETTEEIKTLLNKHEIQTRLILEHYGKELIEKMAMELISRGFLLQMDIDAILHSDFRPEIPRLKKEKGIIGYQSPI